MRTLSFVETATLKIRLVRIHYKNAARAMDIAAPTTADFWTTAQYTLKTYPIPGIDVVRDTVELYDGDFTSFFASAGPGAQGTTGTIFDILTNLRNAESFLGIPIRTIPSTTRIRAPALASSDSTSSTPSSSIRP